jgi:hypothetical protein
VAEGLVPLSLQPASEAANSSEHSTFTIGRGS